MDGFWEGAVIGAGLAFVFLLFKQWRRVYRSRKK